MDPDRLVTVGKITRVHGVKGWLRLHSFTDPESNILEYRPWWLAMPQGYQSVEVDQWRALDRGFLVHIRNIDDRDAASRYCQREIRVDPGVFARPDADELYWYQLQGLSVYSTYQGHRVRLGRVTSLLNTGANDVLVVRGDKDSLDRRERLLPFVDDYVERVDLEQGELEINWDPEF